MISCSTSSNNCLSCVDISVIRPWIIYNYPPKGRWIVVDIYRDAKRRVIYPPLFTDPEGDSCFRIYQIRWIKKCCFNFFFRNFHEMTRHFSLHLQNSEYPRIFRVTGANQNARKLLSTDLVNTNIDYEQLHRMDLCLLKVFQYTVVQTLFLEVTSWILSVSIIIVLFAINSSYCTLCTINFLLEG